MKCCFDAQASPSEDQLRNSVGHVAYSQSACPSPRRKRFDDCGINDSFHDGYAVWYLAR
jgi:hypothetical protein